MKTVGSRTGVTAAGFRRIALSMNGAVEGAHMGHPDFRGGGRIFATLHAGMKHGMVKLTPEQQQELMRTAPDAFSPEAGAWGRSGCTRVTLNAADEETLGEAMTLAWQQTAGSAPTRRPRPGAAKKARKRR